MVWGKLLGGVFGFMVGGPLGAVLGAALGHNFDRGLQNQLPHDDSEDALSPGDADRVRMAFFTATFSVMGHIAKADGRVAQSELDLAEAIMQRMSLTQELRSAAIKLFNEGKQPAFELEPLLLQFRQECQRRTSLYRIFLEIQIQAAYADGELAAAEEKVLLRIADVLGFSEFVFRQLEMLVRFSMGLAGAQGSAGAAGGAYQGGADRGQGAPPASASLTVDQACKLLGVESSDDKATVKRAYRRLMSQHHPDKLIAKGLPEEMIRLATDKTQNIQKAYERIKEAKGW
jgi:DnaJ like chaperone protein